MTDEYKKEDADFEAESAETEYLAENSESDVKALRQKLAHCRKEKDEYLLGWQRCKADAINLRQEEEAKRRDVVRFGAEKLIRSLMPVLTTFEHALRGKEKTDPYIQGFGHIYAQLLSLLGAEGLMVIAETGELFDPARHEAVETVGVSEAIDDNKILETVENGYALHGKVIKAAKVKVGEYKNHET